MPVHSTSRLSLAPSALVRKLDDESVVLNLDTEQYYGLDEVGTRMLDALCTAGSVEDAWGLVAREYDVEPAILQDDLTVLADKLVARGVLRVSDS